MLGDPGSILGLGRSRGEGMATCSIILAQESHGDRSLAGYVREVAERWTRLSYRAQYATPC